jgi:4-amino-4-deoxy-L-arabinose transferase-like glycosyltransferase
LVVRDLRRGAAGLLLIAALALAILGQIYFFSRREYLWDGAVLHLLAAVGFLLAWRLGRPQQHRTDPARSPQLAKWLRGQPAPALLFVMSAVLSLIASLLSRNQPVTHSTAWAVLLWGLGIVAMGLAVLWPVGLNPLLLPGRQARWQSISRGVWLEIATVVAVTVLAMILRVAALGSVPYTLGGDEAWHGLLARQVLTGELRNAFTMGYMSMPTLFYWPLSGSLWLFGDNVTGLRMPAALIGTITVPILYLFARDLWGRKMALLSALFLATYDYHIHYSRLGANNVWDPLFVVLTLWLLDKGMQRLASDGAQSPEMDQSTTDMQPYRCPASRWWAATGLIMGLSTFFYTGARLLPALVVIYVAYGWIQRRGNLQNVGKHVGILALAFLIAAGPILSYAQAHPDDWNARINQVGIVQSGWLDREPEITGKSTTQILMEQFLHAAGAFHVFPDRTAWYGAERPLLGLLAGAFAVLGMAWAVAHWRDRRYFLILIWFWGVIVAGGMLTESPPSSQRLVIAIPAVALLVACGLQQTVHLARRLTGFSQTWENVTLGLLITILALSSVQYYFIEFTPSRRYGSENGETATMIGQYLRNLEERDQVYLFAAPRIYWKFGTMAFLAPEVSGQDVVEPLFGPPELADGTAALSAGHNLAFVFLPERSADLIWVEQAFPDGQVQGFYDTDGKLRFTVYQVP